MAQEKCGPTGGLPIRAPTRSDAPPSAPAAPPSALAAAERPRSRDSSADCDLSYLLTGVFSAPASGVFEAPTRGTGRRIYNYYYNYYIPDIFLYFTELVYSNIEIPVNEFYA